MQARHILLVAFQALGDFLQRIVDTGNVPHHIIGKFRRMGQVLFHGHFEFRAVKAQFHGKTTVLPKFNLLAWVIHQAAGRHDCLARFLALRICRPHNGHGKSIFFGRMRLQYRQVGIQAVDVKLGFFYLIGVISPHFILHLILLRLVV